MCRAIYKPRREGSGENSLAYTLTLNFQPPELWENQLLLFKPPVLWHLISTQSLQDPVCNRSISPDPSAGKVLKNGIEIPTE